MNDFRKNILHASGTKVHRITNSLGVYDAYKWLRRNKWRDVGPVTEKEFYMVIREVNNALAEKFLTVGRVTFPYSMGEIFIVKFPPKIQFENNKMKTSLTVDWDATLNLWEEDEEARRNKTIIRRETENRYRPIYGTHKAIYNNAVYYNFKCNKLLVIAAIKKCEEGTLDAFMTTQY